LKAVCVEAGMVSTSSSYLGNELMGSSHYVRTPRN
jgi:hypothetical protein